MTQSLEEIGQLMGTIERPGYADLRWDAATNAWTEAKKVIGNRRVTLGPQASQQGEGQQAGQRLHRGPY